MSSRLGIGLLVLVGGCLLLTQAQGVLINAKQAVGGSFGVRPMSHDCVGLRVREGSATRWFPHADVQFHVGRFHFRYVVQPPQPFGGERDYCVGQDIWFGE